MVVRFNINSFNKIIKFVFNKLKYTYAIFTTISWLILTTWKPYTLWLTVKEENVPRTSQDSYLMLPSSFHSLSWRENMILFLVAKISCILYKWHQTLHTILCLVFKINTVRFIHIMHVVECLFLWLSRISLW